MDDFYRSIIDGDLHILTYFMSVLIVFAVLMVVVVILNRGLKSWIREEGFEILKRLRSRIRLPVILLVIFLSLVIPASFFDQEISPLGPLSTVMSVMVIIFVSWILIQSVHLIKHFVISRYDIGEKDNLKARKIYTQFRVLET